MTTENCSDTREIQRRIHIVRGKRVILDADPARYYGVMTLGQYLRRKTPKAASPNVMDKPRTSPIAAI